MKLDGQINEEDMSVHFDELDRLHKTIEERRTKLNEAVARYDEELNLLVPQAGVTPEAGVIVCNSCGAKNQPDIAFCGSCGNKLS